MAKERIEIMENFVSSTELPNKLKGVALGNAYYSAAILRSFDKNVPYKKYLWQAFRSRRGFIENSKIRELIYLTALPVSELLWKRLRSAKNIR